MLSAAIAPAQNLVPNNGFETNDGTPTGFGQWYHATGWSDVNNYLGFVWPYASPDYLHNTGGGGADLPICTFGTVTPYAGNAIMGFVTWISSAADFREYISIQLSSPMVVGTTYYVSFWLTNGSASWYNGYSSNRIGARFSVGPLTQSTHEPIGGVPQCEWPTDTWSTTWQYISFVYTPDQAYDRITIGNFYNDASTSHTYRVASMSAGAYYFIDEVVVEPATPLPVELTAFEANPYGQSVKLNWSTESEWKLDAYAVTSGTDGNTFSAIGQVTATGGMNAPVDYHFTDDAPKPGINYYRLEMLNSDGSVDYSEIRTAFVDGSKVQPIAYPNPSHGKVTIANLDPEKVQVIQCFDITGRRVAEIQSIGGDVIDLSFENKGTYVITVTCTDYVYNYIQVIE